jgi:hypothetical protein
MSMIENDVCVIYVKEMPQGFIRIDSIIEDSKPGWYSVGFTKLEFPLVTITWKLEESHLKGEIIYMNGIPIRFQVIEQNKKEVKKVKEDDGLPKKVAKVISMACWKEEHKVREIPQEIA